MSPKEFTFEIKGANLFMKKYRLSSDTRLNIEKTLSNEMNALYEFRRSLVKTFTIPNARSGFNHEHLFLGPCSIKIIIGFVDNLTYFGAFNLNLFIFQHFDVIQR